MSYRRFHKRCDGSIEGSGGVIEVATEVCDFDGAIEGFGGVIGVATELGDFDGVIEGAAVSLKASTLP